MHADIHVLLPYGHLFSCGGWILLLVYNNQYLIDKVADKITCRYSDARRKDGGICSSNSNFTSIRQYVRSFHPFMGPFIMSRDGSPAISIP